MKKSLFALLVVAFLGSVTVAQAHIITVKGSCEGVNSWVDENRILHTEITCEGSIGTCVQMETENGALKIRFFCEDSPIVVEGTGGKIDGIDIEDYADDTELEAGSYHITVAP